MRRFQNFSAPTLRRGSMGGIGSGGHGVNAGRRPDPHSARSEKRVATVVVSSLLPPEGYRKRGPAFPLPQIKRESTVATRSFRSRELAIWRSSWKSPQADAWSKESWRWETIAEFCRIKASIELDAGGNAALVSRLREYRTEIGLSPAGMRANGWAIRTKDAEVAPARPAAKPKPRRRLRAIEGGLS